MENKSGVVVEKKVKLIVVIPCFNDTFIFNTLKSLEETTEPESGVEVIVVVNSAVNTPTEIVDTNRDIFDLLKKKEENEVCKKFKLHALLLEKVPDKIAGVGYARKTGMQLAVSKFKEYEEPDGLIVSLDADCKVDKDYFVCLEKSLKAHEKKGAFVFQFRHDFDSEIYSAAEINACRQYEMYLRYYRLALKLTGFPYSFHTIGSCFAVKASVYEKAGGMPAKKGGEDFYFLHKVAPIQGVEEINQLLVYPSPRVSDRVPFGTGPAVRNIIENKDYKIYNLALFFVLKLFFEYLKEISTTGILTENGIPEEILTFAGKDNLIATIKECICNAKPGKNLEKRLFSKFDAFWVIKFLNSFKNSTLFPPVEVGESVTSLLHYYDFTILPTLYDAILALDTKKY
jgi:hypothetical protein